MWCASLFITYTIALIINLLIESPIIQICKLIFDKNLNQSKTSRKLNQVDWNFSNYVSHSLIILWQKTKWQKWTKIVILWEMNKTEWNITFQSSSKCQTYYDIEIIEERDQSCISIIIAVRIICHGYCTWRWRHHTVRRVVLQKYRIEPLAIGVVNYKLTTKQNKLTIWG